MDLITHALSGAAIGAACASHPREQATLMMVGAAAGMAPDLDALCGLRSRLAAWRHHRVLLHGLPTVPLQALLILGLFSAVLPPSFSTATLAAVIVAGLLVHLALDTVTSFGTALAFPFSRRRFSTCSHFIVDPVVLGTLAAGLALGEPAGALALSAAWLVAGLALRRRLARTLRQALGERAGQALDIRLEPCPLAPFRWLAIVRETATRASIARISWRGRLLEPWRVLESRCEQALQAQACQSALLRAFLDTNDSPLWTVLHRDAHGATLLVEDLKWRICPPYRPLAFVVRMAAGAAPHEVMQMPMAWQGPRRSATPSDTDARRAVIVTTAAPPWYTGTALNPIHRAQALARQGWQVTLLFPWLEPHQQAAVFPAGQRFAGPSDQARWIAERFATGPVQLWFYPATWSPTWRSLFPAGRFARHLPGAELLILEEPEHLALWRPWLRLRHDPRFGAVAGILHTNYAFYLQALTDRPGLRWVPAAVSRYLAWVAARNCHRCIRLSAAVAGPADARVDNVHGVDARFMAPDMGQDAGGPREGLYFTGKLIWEKGWRELIELLAASGVPMLHAFGSGEASVIEGIRALAHRHGVQVKLHGPTAQPWRDLRRMKVFVNCSRSEVLCTTTAEALAMGQFALVPRHPSNAFFEGHPNCLVYGSPQEFKALLAFALEATPQSVDGATLFSWDAATDRLLRALQLEPALPGPAPAHAGESRAARPTTVA